MDQRAIEIKVKKQPNGKRIALWRVAGTRSTFWHYIPVRDAERALRDGVVSIGLIVNAPAIAAA